MLEDLPAFLTVEQAAKALQLGRSTAYQLTVEYDRSGGKSGLPFVWFGCQKRIPRAALVAFIERVLPATAPASPA
jgi:excisionase family DNA binding protein